MMLKKYFALLALLCTCQLLFAQKTLPGSLHISWQLQGNYYQQKPQSRSVLTLKTDKALPASGWTIYFNFARLILPASVDGPLQINHVSGDFYGITPTSAFKGLTAGQSLDLAFTSTDWLINRTDAPGGFYIVWSKTPTQTQSINLKIKQPADSVKLMRIPQDKVAPVTAASIFERNQSIQNIPADSLMKIFPTPASYRETPGYFVLDASVSIQADFAFQHEKIYLQETLNELLLFGTSAKSAKKIILQKQAMSAEAYTLSVTTNSIIITAGDGAGIFYGIQSLKTLMPPKAWQGKQKSISLKNVEVTDAPRFGYRAVMLDVARNFQPKREILRLLDLLSLYKLNVFHFHLTDDEGWRLAIPGLPELTAVGARRGHTLTESDRLHPALGSGPEVNNASGTGFYSVEDFQEILKYATARHIRVIPEIEGPGHARAAIKAMDARYKHYLGQGNKAEAERYLLHDLNDTSKYQSVQYYNDNVVDAAMPSVYNFINKITAELVKAYAQADAPLTTIHYGGDEVPAGAWQGSPALSKLMQRDTSIHNADDLWLYYYSHINNILKAHQLYLTAWEETGLVKTMQNGKKINTINNGLLNQNIHLEVWNNVLGWGAEDLAYKQANAGYKVILSCVSNLYFDMANEKALDEPGYYWGGYNDVESSFKFIPYNYFKNTATDRLGNPLNPAYLASKEQLTDAGKANIVGLQGALWAETLTSNSRMEYMLLPKLFGLAERAWSADPQWAQAADSTFYQTAWSKFVNIISKRELPRLDNYAGGFNYRIPEVGISIQNGLTVMNSQLPGFGIRYTTDGSEPTLRSPVYTHPVKTNGQVKAQLFNEAGKHGRAIGL